MLTLYDDGMQLRERRVLQSSGEITQLLLAASVGLLGDFTMEILAMHVFPNHTLKYTVLSKITHIFTVTRRCYLHVVMVTMWLHLAQSIHKPYLLQNLCPLPAKSLSYEKESFCSVSVCTLTLWWRHLKSSLQPHGAPPPHPLPRPTNQLTDPITRLQLPSVSGKCRLLKSKQDNSTALNPLSIHEDTSFHGGASRFKNGANGSLAC